MDSDIDILVITYNRPVYTALAISRLLDTCDERMRVWIWQNGSDRETVDVVRSFSSHPRVHRFHHSLENKRLATPTNWLFENAEGEFVCKVDDDCLMPYGWADTLRRAHGDESRFGVLGCWRFPDEDFVPELAERKIRTFAGGHRLLTNCWVEGSGYLMRRECVRRQGLLPEGGSFSRYCIDLAKAGWVNGWYYPFLYQEHMDDPRSPNSLLKSDADIERYLPLSAKVNGVTTVAEWQAQLKRSARLVQEVSADPRHHTGWRYALKRVRNRARRLMGVRSRW